MKGAPSDDSVMINVVFRKKQRLEDKTRSAMLDFDVLDCPVCFEPLTIPIFQCDNGHLACSSCCPKLSNKCPACALPIAHNRCRAMESVVESVFVPCPNAKFGCSKKWSYGKESTHEKECIFSQCSCPVQDCNYSGSYKDLYAHYISIHKSLAPRVSCGKSFDVLMNKSFHVRMNIIDKILIKSHFRKRLLFAVQCFREPYGVYVTISCIAPSAFEVGKFSYLLNCNVDGHVLVYSSPEVRKVLKVSYQTPQEDFLLIPNIFLRDELLEMDICISEGIQSV